MKCNVQIAIVYDLLKHWVLLHTFNLNCKAVFPIRCLLDLGLLTVRLTPQGRASKFPRGVNPNMLHNMEV